MEVVARLPISNLKIQYKFALFLSFVVVIKYPLCYIAQILIRFLSISTFSFIRFFIFLILEHSLPKNPKK